jgi:hypothetical protein
MWYLFRHFLSPLIVFAFPVLSRLLAKPSGAIGECVHNPLGALRLDNHEICLPSEGHQAGLASKKDTNRWAPWAHAPFCVRDSTEVEKYCVYTSADFNSNTGASFIIHPDTLPKISAFVQNTKLTLRGQKYLTGRYRSDDPDISYELKELLGKEWSVIARRPIRRGEIFMVGFPAIVIDQELEMGPDPEISEYDRLRLYELAFEQLPDKGRALSLAASTGGNIHEDIMRTNAFGLKIGGRGHSGLFPETAVSFVLGERLTRRQG